MAKQKQFYVIVNPTANRGDAAAMIPQLESLFNTKKIEYKMEVTKAPLHATELARQAASSGYPVIIAAGGDGTVNEVVNGLVGSDSVLGVLPLGSGNDFSKNLALRKQDLDFDLKVLLKKKVKKIDLGIINDHYFASQTSMGFTGRVNNYVKQSPAFLRGYSMMIYSIMRILIDYYPHHLQITMKDDKDKTIKLDGDYTICDVGNGRYEGDGFQLTPDARLDDGILDVCLADTVTRKYILRLLPKIMQGQHVNMPHISMYKVKEITVESDKIIPLHYDGELNNQYKKVVIKVVPAALKVISHD
ncbi:MAG: diacylglycerol kinase family protein [Patescibacteria group bacterium]